MASNVTNSTIDMITEILSRLPSKSLIRFKGVCRNWLALITSSRFITLHYQLRPKQSLLLSTLHGCTSSGRESCSWITLILPDGISTCRLGRDHVDNGPYGAMPPSIIDKLEGSGAIAHLVGSGNGLLCFSTKQTDYLNQDDKDYILWNPATKQHRHLPVSPLVISHQLTTCVSGFGFDQGINDYKLIRVLRNLGISNVYIAEVFSLRVGFWREIECPMLRSGDGSYGFHSGSGVVFKDLWYQTVTKYPSKMTHLLSSEVILTYDMSNDTFSEMECQLPYNDFSNIDIILMVYKDSLAMSLNIFGYKESEGKDIFSNEIWTMKNDESSSWTRLFILMSPLIPEFSFILGVWNDKEIILSKFEDRDMGLHLFDPLTQQLKNLPEYGSHSFSAAHTYFESLVSIL